MTREVTCRALERLPGGILGILRPTERGSLALGQLGSEPWQTDVGEPCHCPFGAAVRQ